MKTIRNIATTIGLFALLGLPIFAQGPIHKQLFFDINVPYQLRMTDYIIPEGHYILRQMDANDINLFALYQGDMMHAPIAMVRTVRIPYISLSDTPQKTEIMIREDESSPDATPIVRGWTIPGED